MTRLVLFLFFSLSQLVLFGQVKTKVLYNDKEVKLSKDTVKQIVVSQSENVKDSIEQLDKGIKQIESKRLADFPKDEKEIKNQIEDSVTQNKLWGYHRAIHDSISILSQKLSDIKNSGLKYRQVYSEKAIKALYDSLGVSKLPDFPLKEISKDEFIMLVNEKFSSNSLAGQDSLTSKLPSGDISSQKLEQAALLELTPISGLLTKSKYLDNLDSVRKINLKKQGLELEERTVSAISKVTSIRKRQIFWDKTYFEGIIGISNIQKFLPLQLSPSLGYHFTKRFSLGIGPVIHIWEKEKGGAMSMIGVRPYIKQEFFKRKAYLQVEYTMNPSTTKTEDIILNRHNVLAGGGVLVALSSSISINIALLYQLNENRNEDGNISPWVFRIGISSTKVKN